MFHLTTHKSTVVQGLTISCRGVLLSLSGFQYLKHLNLLLWLIRIKQTESISKFRDAKVAGTEKVINNMIDYPQLEGV